jgi:hydroxyacylglutathione hydrolase
MDIRQIFDPDIAHSSYMIWDSKDCAVIDPRRDAKIYMDHAIREGLKITHILLTHLHADFIGGHLELARLSKAPIYISKNAGCNFEHNGLEEGDIIDLEKIRLKVIETPGHSPEMINYLAYDLKRSPESPAALFSGDTLFGGDVGRPDIFPEKAEALAKDLYESLYYKIKELADWVEVYPAHGPGSLCGKSISKKKTTTIGYEKKNNPLLKFDSLEDFKESLLSEMPPAPSHFSLLSEKNRKGPAMLSDLPGLLPLNVDETIEATEEKKTVVCDIRRYDAFGVAHIKGSINIDASDNLTIYGGTFIGQDNNVVLVCPKDADALDAFTLLRRIGIDGKITYIQGGIKKYLASGRRTGKIDILTPQQLKALREQDEDYIILDVRNKNEYDMLHFEEALFIPLRYIEERYNEVPKDKKVIIHCSSGIRSGTAASLLKRKGFDEVFNLAGGITAYAASGYPL